MQQDAAFVDEFSANRKPERKDSYTAAFDRADYGLHGSTYGRVTLYFNPHDHVISATPVQGIGWRGMSAQEIADTGGEGVFTQRVFAQNHLVGQENEKDYDISQRNGQPLTPDSIDF
ncbi:T6SS effector phospholipase Tle3 domain-containing protein [Janthinobacterium sp. GB4P2]|uniref:T6SS effector phospholipase Tle3 domain-containing protein n=1 Tax=Janthinobacterium sp. GB4P2 TaxID=3424189 RepID=UPI003F28CA37